MSPIRVMMKTWRRTRTLISDASNTCVSCPGILKPHQSVEHQHVVRLLVRRLHHDAEEGVQGVLQELPSTTRRKKIKRISIKTETATSSRRPSRGSLTLTISPPSTSISRCRICSRSAGLDLQFSKPSRSTGRQNRTNQTPGSGSGLGVATASHHPAGAGGDKHTLGHRGLVLVVILGHEG